MTTNDRLSPLYKDLRNAWINEELEYSTIKTFYKEFYFFLSESLTIEKNKRKTLVNCCVLFVECISVFQSTHESPNPKHIMFFKKCLEIIADVLEIEDVKDWYIGHIGIPLLEMVIRPDSSIWFNKELLKNLKIVANNSSKHLRYNLVKDNVYLFCKLIDELCVGGDFEYQMILLEIVFLMFSDELIQKYSQLLFPESQSLKQSFCEINRNNLFYEIRKFLNIVNLTFKNVLSFKFEFGIMDTTHEIQPPKNFDGDSELWVDFNITTKSLGIPCCKNTFSDKMCKYDNEIDFITILFEDITMVRMSKNNLNSACGSIILFKLNPEGQILSSQNIATYVLKLIVFNPLDIEALENDILPLLFKDKFQILVRSLQEDTDDEKDDDVDKRSEIFVGEQQPRNPKKNISGAIETSTVSDALSLKSKLQDFVLHSYNFERTYLSKRPNIKNVEQLVNVSGQHNFDACNKTGNEKLEANHQNEDLRSQEFESSQVSTQSYKKNVQTRRDTLDESFFSNDFMLPLNTTKVKEIRPPMSESKCSTNSIDSSSSEKLGSSMSHINGISTNECKDTTIEKNENDHALDTINKSNAFPSVSYNLKNDSKKQLKENDLDTRLSKITVSKSKKIMNVSKILNTAEKVHDTNKDITKQNAFANLSINKAEDLFKIPTQKSPRCDDEQNFNSTNSHNINTLHITRKISFSQKLDSNYLDEEILSDNSDRFQLNRSINLNEVIVISDDDDNNDCLTEINFKTAGVRYVERLESSRHIESTGDKHGLITTEKELPTKNSNCLELDDDESDIFNTNDVQENYILSNQSINLNGSIDSFRAVENDLIKILAAGDNEDQNSHLSLARKTSNVVLQDERSESSAKIISQKHEGVNLNALVGNKSNDEEVLLQTKSTVFQNTEDISLHDFQTISREPYSQKLGQSRNSIEGFDEFLGFNVNNSNSDIIANCLRDTKLCNSLQSSPVQNSNHANIVTPTNLNNSEICNKSLQSNDSASKIKRKLNTRNDTGLNKIMDEHTKSHVITYDEFIVLPVDRHTKSVPVVPIKAASASEYELLPENNLQKEEKNKSNDNEKHFTLKEVSVRIEFAAQEAVNRFIEKRDKKNLDVNEQTFKKKIKAGKISNESCEQINKSKTLQMEPGLQHKDNFDEIKTAFKDNLSRDLNYGNDDKRNVSLFKLRAKDKRNSSDRRSVYSEGSAKKFKLYNPNNPISIFDSTLIDNNNHDAFKLLNNSQTVQKTLEKNDNLIKTIFTVNEPSKDTNNTDINLLDIEKNNAEDLQFANKQPLPMKVSSKNTHIDDKVKIRTTRKIHILQNVTLRKSATLETSARKSNELDREKHKLKETDGKSNFIALLESLCPVLTRDETVDKRETPCTSKVLNKQLFRKKTTRYSKLKLYRKSNDQRIKIKKTNGINNNRIHNDFDNDSKTYWNNCEKINKAITDSHQTDASDAEMRSLANEILQNDLDEYGLLKQAISSCKNQDSKSRAALNLLNKLENIISEYLTNKSEKN